MSYNPHLSRTELLNKESDPLLIPPHKHHYIYTDIASIQRTYVSKWYLELALFV
jgi:hypothetical protein